ncbi:MAG: hypothetical protein OXH53_13465 [bacterium]|nr:hypothetical protein [bacterium]
MAASLVLLIAGMLAWAVPGPVALAQGIPGPDFCANQSLGGPQTYPHDSNGDGVADVCSLPGTRREAVARQNAFETLAALFPEAFIEALHGMVDDPETPDVDESTQGTCASAPDDLGDSEDDLANDACGRAQREQQPERGVSAPPPPVDPVVADVFFSGYITGPDWCTNHSLGGARTYAHDSEPKDGVADVCSLPYTRREAVARQNALVAAFADHPVYEAALTLACTRLGTLDFDDHPDDLAVDACNPPSGPGQPLPTPE